MDSANMKYVSCSMLDSLSTQLMKNINKMSFFAKSSSESITHQLSQTKARGL